MRRNLHRVILVKISSDCENNFLPYFFSRHEIFLAHTLFKFVSGFSTGSYMAFALVENLSTSVAENRFSLQSTNLEFKFSFLQVFVSQICVSRELPCCFNGLNLIFTSTFLLLLVGGIIFFRKKTMICNVK